MSEDRVIKILTDWKDSVKEFEVAIKKLKKNVCSSDLDYIRGVFKYNEELSFFEDSSINVRCFLAFDDMDSPEYILDEINGMIHGYSEFIGE